jgi:hypothetical protein
LNNCLMPLVCISVPSSTPQICRLVLDAVVIFAHNFFLYYFRIYNSSTLSSVSYTLSFI